MNFDALKENVIIGVQMKMAEVAEHIAEDMRQHLADGGHIDTGNLYNSISTKTERTDKEINAYIDIGAESDEGAWYAEFIEFGTGIYNENGDGRQTPWRYQDREGNWHTTSGQQADPFIRPSVAAHIGELDQGIKEAMDIRRYGK